MRDHSVPLGRAPRGSVSGYSVPQAPFSKHIVMVSAYFVLDPTSMYDGKGTVALGILDNFSSSNLIMKLSQWGKASCFMCLDSGLLPCVSGLNRMVIVFEF